MRDLTSEELQYVYGAGGKGGKGGGGKGGGGKGGSSGGGKGGSGGGKGSSSLCLIVQEEFPKLDGAPEPLFQLQPGVRPAIYVAVEQAVAATAVRLALVKGRVGALE